MHLVNRIMIAALAMMLLVSVPARAVDLNHSFILGADAGFDINPTMFASALVGEYMVTSNVGMGPYFQFAAKNDRFYFGTSGIAKYKANLNESAKLKPYGMMGIGFLVKEEREHHRWDHETDFLLPIGGGFEYWATNRFAWGGNIVFDISDKFFMGVLFGVRTRF